MEQLKEIQLVLNVSSLPAFWTKIADKDSTALIEELIKVNERLIQNKMFIYFNIPVKWEDVLTREAFDNTIKKNQQVVFSSIKKLFLERKFLKEFIFKFQSGSLWHKLENWDVEKSYFEPSSEWALDHLYTELSSLIIEFSDLTVNEEVAHHWNLIDFKEKLVFYTSSCTHSKGLASSVQFLKEGVLNYVIEKTNHRELTEVETYIKNSLLEFSDFNMEKSEIIW